MQAAQRQAYPGQLLLGEVVQHIALVFALVQSLFQEPAARGLVLLHPGIMARDHIVDAVGVGPAEQMVKFHVFVAVDAGVGRAARLIHPDEFLDDLLPEIGGKIHHFIGDVHGKRHLSGILDIPFRAAGVETGLSQRLVAGKPHGNARALTARLLHQPCRHRAVHAAAHGNEGLGRVLYFCHANTPVLFNIPNQ